MNLIEVLDDKTSKEFLLVPKSVLGDDPNYIRVLDTDTNEVFSEKNLLIKRGGKYRRWIVKDASGNLIGRIAAFVNPKYKNKIPVGGVGFFDSINDFEVAKLLLDTSQKWLKEEGMEAMDGPINFGERDRFWGVLVEGFLPPIYGMHFARPYYHELLEQYGFKLYFDQLCYGMPWDHVIPEKYNKKYEQISQDENYQMRPVKKNNLRKYSEDFCDIYNAAWASHGGGKTMDKRQAFKIFTAMKPIMDEKLANIVYYKDQPVGMWMSIPDINSIMKNFDGKFGWFNKLRFIIQLRMNKCDRAVGVIFGVVPEHQSKGVEAMLIVEGAKIFREKTKYKYYEMQWVGDFNPKMVNVAKALEGGLTRKLRTYRYLFDPEMPYERHPMIS